MEGAYPLLVVKSVNQILLNQQLSNVLLSQFHLNQNTIFSGRAANQIDKENLPLGAVALIEITGVLAYTPVGREYHVGVLAISVFAIEE